MSRETNNNLDTLYYSPSTRSYSFGPSFSGEEANKVDKGETKMKPIKSNGGSSAYYTLIINDQTVQTEDVIRDVFANDFDFGNAFKSLVRAYGALNGAGKDGNTVDYEMNKLRYSSKKIEKQNG